MSDQEQVPHTVACAGLASASGVVIPQEQAPETADQEDEG
jgi:hypothetical protein